MRLRTTITTLGVVLSLGATAVPVAQAAARNDPGSASTGPVVGRPVVAQPDLVVGSVTESSVSTTVTVKNVPDPTLFTAAAGPFVVRITQWFYVSCWMFCDSGWTKDYSQDIYVSSLASGASTSFVGPATQDWVCVEVDPLNQVAERSESNNTWWGWPYANHPGGTC